MYSQEESSLKIWKRFKPRLAEQAALEHHMLKAVINQDAWRKTNRWIVWSWQTVKNARLVPASQASANPSTCRILYHCNRGQRLHQAPGFDYKLVRDFSFTNQNVSTLFITPISKCAQSSMGNKASSYLVEFPKPILLEIFWLKNKTKH